MKVYDASAVVALIKSEPGADVVAQAMLADEAWISSVNWCEVVTSLVEGGADELAVLEALAQLDLHIEPLDARVALAAARLRPATRQLGLSLGDRCCLALAQERGVQAVTADRPWKKLKGFDLLMIR